MSVVIKNMEMPKNCYDCDLSFQDQDSEHNVYWMCAALHKGAYMYERHPDCPLVEIPAHRRLIDADALCYQLSKQETIDGQPRAIRRARKIVMEFPPVLDTEDTL